MLWLLVWALPPSVSAEPKPGWLAVGQNADGRLELFRVDDLGEVLHRWQKVVHGDWSSWSSLGGGFLPGVTVANNADGTLEVFAVAAATQALKCARQTAPNALDFGAWVEIGGNIRPPVAVGQNLDGRLQVFALEATNQVLKHLWQTDLQGGWSSWMDSRRVLEPGMAVCRNQDGRLELFAFDPVEGGLAHCWQTLPNGVNNWSAWPQLGVTNALPGLAVGRSADGGVAVFWVTPEGAVNYLHQLFAPRGIAWSEISSLGGNLREGISVAQNADGSLEIFAVARANDTLLHCRQVNPQVVTNWGAWTSLEEPGVLGPVVTRNRDGALEIFSAPATNAIALRHRRQASANGPWLDWSDLEHATVQYVSRTWQSDAGLPHNQVQAIAQTPDGYLWAGTRDGLARFDGVEFTAFTPENTPGLSNPFISALCVDREGALWVGTWNGLARMKDGRFAQYGRAQGLVGDQVTSIQLSRDGSLWIGTTSGASRFQEGRFSNLTRAQGLPSDLVTCTYEDANGDVWLATGQGVVRWRKNGAGLSRESPDRSVHCICQDERGRLWLGSNHGLFSPGRGPPQVFGPRQGLSDSFISALFLDRQGNFWVGTYGGLDRFREGRFFPDLTADGQAYDKVLAIFEDREGTLWVGSRDGLTRLTPKRIFACTARQGLTHNNVMSVLQDRAGDLWLGTWNGGLNQLRDERVRAYATSNGFPHDLILSLCEARDGSLWAGADFDGGLIHIKEGKFTHYTWTNGLPNAAIRVIHEDRDGALWVGTSRGLSCFAESCFTNYSVKHGLASDTVHAICEDHAGRLWFGTERGLSRWNQGRFESWTTTNGLSAPAVLALYEDKEKNLWIGTVGGGLDRMPLADEAGSGSGRISVYTTRQGLFSDDLFEILEDDYGWLWMSCSRGVFRVHKPDLLELDQGKTKAVTSIAYGKADGLESTLCNAVGKPAGWKTRDGKLWFPTTKGLIGFLPDLQLRPAPTPVFIERLIADRKPVPIPAPTAPNQPAPAPASNAGPPVLTLAPGRGELEFHYTALNYQTPEKSLFKYQLEGADSDWVEAGTRRVAHYNNIYPGSYRFHVLACNGDGVWSGAGATLAVVLEPHFWQTWWFRGLAGLALLGGVGGSARYVTQRRLQRKLELLEHQHAVEKERGRIAKDIHDDLGASLTRIMMLGERAREDANHPSELEVHTAKIVTSARAAVQALDEIVWAVNPENDTLDGLVGYINQYATQFFEGTPVRCRLELPARLPPLLLPAEVRHDLFLVVKEALTNVLRHAQASQVQIRVAAADTAIELQVQDNGRGFDAAAGAAGGNGLANMRQRLERLGGTFSLASAPGHGTSLTFTVAVRKG